MQCDGCHKMFEIRQGIVFIFNYLNVQDCGWKLPAKPDEMSPLSILFPEPEWEMTETLVVAGNTEETFSQGFVVLECIKSKKREAKWSLLS